MKPWTKTLLLGVALLLVYAVALDILWEKDKLLGLTCALIAAATAGVGWILYVPEGPVVSVAGERPASPVWMQALLGLVGLACAWRASQDGIAGSYLPMALWIVASAAVWRATVFDPLPLPGGWTWALLVAVVVLLGAIFRLTDAGAVPRAMIGNDECTFWEHTWGFLLGKKATYDVWTYDGGDGGIPLYLMGIGLKLFGGSIFAFRIEGIVSGILLTALLYRLGKETLGPWVGLAAGFFWACSLWPVTVTRANYLMAETTLVVVSCLTMLAVGLRKGKGWRFALAGLLWGCCFNVYPAARVMLALIPWLYCLLWYTRSEARPTLVRSTAPLAMGFLVGIGPVVLWLVGSYPSGAHVYMAAFSAGQEAGNVAATSLLGRIDETLSRVVGQFPFNFEYLTKHADLPPNYFAPAYPILHPWLFSAAVLGAGVALARFRNAYYAFLLYWWFVGYLPALASGFGTWTTRRAIIILPATLLLAAVGVDTLARTLRALLSWTRAAVLLVGLTACVFGALYAGYSWQDYFDRNVRDPAVMWNGYAPLVEMMRAVHSAVGDEGGVLISTWRPENPQWYAPTYVEMWLSRFYVMSPHTSTYWFQRFPQTFNFSDSLKWAYEQSRPQKPGQPPADVWITLVPFFDYLEPGLKDIGAELVTEVPVPVTYDGPMALTGMKTDPKIYVRLYRIRGLDQAKLDRFAGRPRFRFDLHELVPPAGWTREQVRAVYPLDKHYAPLAASYEKSGRGWGSGRAVSFTTDTPWFWQSAGQLPVPIDTPYSLRFRASVMIPEDGDYSFGASASVYTKISVDKKTVFERDPFDPANTKFQNEDRPNPDITWVTYEKERHGFLGRPLHLAKGSHSLEIDQAFLCRGYFYSHILRPIWRRPGARTQTLPVESLQPLP